MYKYMYRKVLKLYKTIFSVFYDILSYKFKQVPFANCNENDIKTICHHVLLFQFEFVITGKQLKRQSQVKLVYL